MTITVVFDPPLPSDSPATFNTKAFSTLGDLNDWSTEANALAADVTAKQGTASTAATTATTQAGNAAAQAGNAATSASTATTQAGIAIAAAASVNNIETTVHAATTKATPVDADEIPLADSAATFGLKKLTWANLKAAISSYGVFYKTDPATVAFTKTGAGTAQIKAGTKLDVLGTLVTFASATSITMPTLTAGTDYAVWVKDDATIQATTNFSSAPGAGNWRKIGGFHYAPGGNAAAQAGGDTTPAINAYSLWDVNFRPACQDPRGMTLVGDSFWADIYLLGVDHLTNGTSKYNVTIADGSSPPKIPTKFGGNGSTAYSTLNWWEGAEVLNAWGKRYPKYDEFAALAYGTTEASSVGADPASTVLNAAYTSRWGCVQSSGVMWVWGANFGGGAAAAAWVSNTGRGDTYQMENAVLFGGRWAFAPYSGSRASVWINSPTSSGSCIGVRAVADHLILG